MKPESRGQSGRWQSEYHDVMIDHDKNIGEMLDFIDKLGIADNTFVLYSTDNGPHMNTWPDAGTTPFRNEKNSSWEGAYRVPCHGPFPGGFRPDRCRTGSSATGLVPDHPGGGRRAGHRGEAEEGSRAGNKTFKVHLDGYNLLPHLTGKEAKSPRKGFIYFTDDGDVAAMRYDNWKLLFMEQRAPGTLQIWAEPFVTLRCPYIFNLRMDPYEHARHHFEHLLRLDVPAHLPARAGAGDRRGVPGHLQGIPAATEGGELQPRPGRSTSCWKASKRLRDDTTARSDARRRPA